DDTSCSSERSDPRNRTETDDAMSLRPVDHYRPDAWELVFIDVHGRELVIHKLQDFPVPDFFYASSSAVFLHLPWILLCLTSNPS
nr:hypothetical protein [Tanacetum cinerariifolium]